ncbi:MAG: chorismate-binding protein [Phycisphaeraceae bacterium]|nr:chorismate-binding protein [Phycisphaerae bacterium]MBX3391034.1 chorismate-binding protein [Phycisphaeraceae bacterium]
MASISRDEFVKSATRAAADHPGATPCVPIALRVLSDQLTPVLAYRRLVTQDRRDDPSFLLESVEGGERQGRYSILGARPVLEVRATAHKVSISDRRPGGTSRTYDSPDPLAVMRDLTRGHVLVIPPSSGTACILPSCFLGGWVGYTGYDTVRYAEPEKLPFTAAPPDDRGLPDLHFGLYDAVVIFDHVQKVVFLVGLAMVGPREDPGTVYDRTVATLTGLLESIERHSRPLPSGLLEPESSPPTPLPSNMTRADHARMVDRALEYIRAGDIFQVVLGQRFERVSDADPFDVYRALRAVNPSPYMVYLQAPGCILVASSPEILCRVRASGPANESNSAYTVTNRPLAGTRRRGRTPEDDLALERELLADEKERAEHVMLVDLGRNDVGQVARAGSIRLPTVMEVERYSHVMHISSTVTGEIRPGYDGWDALRAALPVGTISGAPKIRAMQVIDEIEPVRRGPYGGGVGYVGLDGQMDIALTLRTIVVPTAMRRGAAWTYHLQAAGGIVADSRHDDEYMETVNKAAALARAVDVAERAFVRAP